MEESKLSRDFKGIWICKEIWLNRNLSIQAKALWAEIDSLYCEERGGCYASDEYLMEFLGVKLSRLHEILKELRDQGLLINVNTDRRNRIIKAINPKVTGNDTSGKPEMTLPENRKLDIRKTGSPIYNDKNKDKKKDNNPLPPKGGSSCSSSKEKTTQKQQPKKDDIDEMFDLVRNKKINITREFLFDCVEKFGMKKTAQAINYYLSKKSSVKTSVEGYIYTALSKGYASDMKEEIQQQDNHQIAEKYYEQCKKHPLHNKNCTIHLGYKYIEIAPIGHCEPTIISFDESDFEERLVKELKRNKLL